MRSKSTFSWWLYGVGLFIVAATHIYMLAVGLPPEQMTAHAVLNLGAGVLLAFGWIKE